MVYNRQSVASSRSMCDFIVTPWRSHTVSSRGAEWLPQAKNFTPHSDRCGTVISSFSLRGVSPSHLPAPGCSWWRKSWLVYRLTDSGLLLGLVGFAGQFPVLLLAPVGGSVADEFRRHRIVLATQAASMFLALTLAFLTLAGQVQIWHVFVLAALMGAVNAFDIPGGRRFWSKWWAEAT